LHRHIALRPLSKEHHAALVLARAVRWACEGRRGTLAEARARVVQAWSTLLAPHFAVEERWLVPHAGELAGALLEQHRDLAEACERVRAAEDATELAAFGRALDDHIRWEERVLFPMHEARLEEADLARIGAALDEHGRGATCLEP